MEQNEFLEVDLRSLPEADLETLEMNISLLSLQLEQQLKLIQIVRHDRALTEFFGDAVKWGSELFITQVFMDMISKYTVWKVSDIPFTVGQTVWLRNCRPATYHPLDDEFAVFFLIDFEYDIIKEYVHVPFKVPIEVLQGMQDSHLRQEKHKEEDKASG